MINDGVTFDMSSGPTMTGTWRNPKTGDKFTVRDTFFQDNQFMVQTTDGRLLDYNIIRDYIKLEKETEQDGAMIDNIFSKQSVDEIPDEVKKLIETDDETTEDSYTKYMVPEDIEPTKSINPRPQLNLNNTNQVVDDDDIFIKRALSNTEIPQIGSDIKWSKCPKKKIDMLINLLDVNPENIANWYINKIDLNELRKNIRKSIINYIEGSESKETDTAKEVPEKHPLRSKKVSK